MEVECLSVSNNKLNRVILIRLLLINSSSAKNVLFCLKIILAKLEMMNEVLDSNNFGNKIHSLLQGEGLLIPINLKACMFHQLKELHL